MRCVPRESSAFRSTYSGATERHGQWSTSERTCSRLGCAHFVASLSRAHGIGLTLKPVTWVLPSYGPRPVGKLVPREPLARCAVRTPGGPRCSPGT